MIKSLFQSAINLVVVPVEIVKDVVTMGGLLTDEKKTYTMQRLEKAQDKLDEALEE